MTPPLRAAADTAPKPKDLNTDDGGLTFSRPDVLIAVIGPTGSGKSSLINLATRSQGLQVGHDLDSCTSNVDAAEPFDLDGFRVTLFDTPGFDNTGMTNKEVLTIIASALESQFRAGQRLAGIIYTHRISDNRADQAAKATFTAFMELCGESSLRNAMIVTTMWSKVQLEQGMERATRLGAGDGLFGTALDRGARMEHLFEETTDCVHGIIRRMLRNLPEELQIQRELVTDGKKIEETRVAMGVWRVDTGTEPSTEADEYRRVKAGLDAMADKWNKKALAFIRPGELYSMRRRRDKMTMGDYLVARTTWHPEDDVYTRSYKTGNWKLIKLDSGRWEIRGPDGRWFTVQKGPRLRVVPASVDIEPTMNEGEFRITGSKASDHITVLISPMES